MEQQQQQQQSSSQLISHQTLLHTPHQLKIKPLLRRCYREIQLNETNYQKSLKTHSKTSRAIKTNTNKVRSSLPQYINGYKKILTTQDSLKKLYYSFNTSVCFENAYLFSKIRGLQNLSSLEAQFFINRRPIPLKLLFKSLVFLKNLTHFKLELNFYGFTDDDAQILYILFKSLRCLKKLKSLSLCFLMCSGFKSANMKDLPKYLSRLKQIQSLELSFDRSREFQDEDIISLASVFPKLPLLTQISLDFGGQMKAIQDSTLIHMFQNTNKLSEITINLAYSRIMKEESASYSLSEGLRLLHAPCLKKLGLWLNKDLETESFTELSQTIKRFTSLERLNVNFFGCETLANQGFVEFGLALGSLTMLSSFDLRISHSVEADCIVGCIASALKSLQNLVNLNLNFANANTSPDQIHQLSASLAKLNSLKFLDISLSSVDCLSDEVMQKLAEALLKLVQLKNLALDFGYAKTVTNQGTDFIADAVKELHSLSFLNLNFAANEEIDEKAVDRVAQVLRYLPSLCSTVIRFSRCPKIQKNDKSLCALFSALREMKNIREVFLNIPHNQINEQEVNDLKQIKILTTHWF